MTKQAIGYTRVSTEKQAKEGVSLEAQKDKIKSWCDFHEYELMHIFTDEGVSGATMGKKRPQLEAALKLTSSGHAFVTYSLSRLTRSTKDLLHIADILQEKGADLVSLSENVDTTSAAGKLMFRMLGVIGEFEKDVIGERTRMAMQTKISKREYWGGKVPYGYKIADNGIDLLEQRDEQIIITFVNWLHNNGATKKRIIEELTKNGHLSRSGKPFVAMQIARMLKTT